MADVAAVVALAVTAVLAAPAHARSAPPAVACGATITAGATLTADLSCVGRGIVIGAPGVTLHLNGHTLSSTVGAGIGVHVPVPDGASWTGVTIVGPGTIAGFGTGVLSSGHGTAGRPSEVTVRDVSFMDNGSAANPRGESLTLDSVQIRGPVGFDRHSSGTVTITGSTIAVTGLALDQAGGSWRIDGSRIAGGSVTVTGGRSTWTRSAFRGVPVTCFEGTLHATESTFLESPVRLARCEGSRFESSQFRAERPGVVALRLDPMDSARGEPTRLAGSRLTGFDTAVRVHGPVGRLEIAGNVFAQNRAGVLQTPCDSCAPSQGHVTGNAFVRGTGDALTLAEGRWRVGANRFEANAGHAVVASAPGLDVVDEGGNVVAANAAPECTGVVCGPPR